jgi:hypothetical protein
MSGETLEDLVQEFAAGTAEPPAPAPLPQQQIEQAAIERAQRDAATAEEMHRKNEQMLSRAVQRFKTGDLANESDALVEGYLLARARRDEKFSSAISSAEPKRANKALAEARRDYSNELRKGYIETDNHRARASVRGNAESDAPPEFDPLRMSRMTPEEWAADVSKRTGQTQHPYGATNYWTGDSRSVAGGPWGAHDRRGAGGGPVVGASAGSAKGRPILGRR